MVTHSPSGTIVLFNIFVSGFSIKFVHFSVINAKTNSQNWSSRVNDILSVRGLSSEKTGFNTWYDLIASFIKQEQKQGDFGVRPAAWPKKSICHTQSLQRNSCMCYWARQLFQGVRPVTSRSTDSKPCNSLLTSSGISSVFCNLCLKSSWSLLLICFYYDLLLLLITFFNQVS